jgi:putative ABC transport system substrate-binding protein
MKRRRALLAASGAWLFAAMARSFAQGSKSLRTIAILIPGTQTGYRSRVDAFRNELTRLGHVEGRDVTFETRWAEDRTEKLASLAAELAASRPAAILTATSAGVRACKAATSTIPIVFASSANPVEQGFVANLRRPGGNVTGVLTVLDAGVKLVELVREAMPQAQRLAIVVHETDPAHKLILDVFLPAAKRFKFEALVVRVNSGDDLPRAVTEIAAGRADAIYLPQLAFSASHGRQFAELSRQMRLPLLTAYADVTAAGGLLSYGTTREESYRRAAALVDKILRGAMPAELPVEQPERVELVVNLKTANVLGIKLPPATIQRADRVID